MICRWESLWCISLHDPMCVWLSAFFFSYNLFLSNLRCTWKFWNVWLLVSVALPIATASEVFWVCHVFLHENTAGDVYTSRNHEFIHFDYTFESSQLRLWHPSFLWPHSSLIIVFFHSNLYLIWKWWLSPIN